MFSRQLNSPAKRAAFLGAIASLVAMIGFIAVAPPLTFKSEQILEHRTDATGKAGDVWKIEKPCADATVPKSSFAHEFWVVWMANSDHPEEASDGRMTLADVHVESRIQVAEREDSYYVSDVDLATVQEKLNANVQRCAGSFCARSLGADMLLEIIGRCGTRATTSVRMRWRLERNPEHEGIPEIGLYTSGGLFVLFLLLSVWFSSTLGRVLEWLKNGSSES